MSKKYRSDGMAAVHETMEALHDAGAIDKQAIEVVLVGWTKKRQSLDRAAGC
jgi:DNA-binding transcriptional regulator YiaG